MTELVRHAEILDEAARHARAVAQLSGEASFSVAEAYEIQRLSIARRLERGERLVGVKMGFTSRAKMVQMGLSDLIWGRLTDAMRVEDGGRLSLAGYVHPRVEPEVAFLLGAPLSGETSPAEAMRAVAGVAPAMEIIDSRYADFRFTLEDVVADNASSSGFVLGPWRSPEIDLVNLGLVLSFDGRPVQVGSTAAILGHPSRSLAAAARLAGSAGLVLEPGMIVLAGGATAAQALSAGTSVEVEISRLGRAAFTVD